MSDLKPVKISGELFWSKWMAEFNKAFNDDKHEITDKIVTAMVKHLGESAMCNECGETTDLECDENGNCWEADAPRYQSTSMGYREMNEVEEDPDVFYISRNESHLHVSDWIYEFVILSIPMQKMCSPDKIGGPQCNTEVLEKLKEMETKHAEILADFKKGNLSDDNLKKMTELANQLSNQYK